MLLKFVINDGSYLVENRSVEPVVGVHDTLLSPDLDGDIAGTSDHGTGISDVPLQGDTTTADKVAEELRKLEKESQEHSDHKIGGEQYDDLDDDELLGAL